MSTPWRIAEQALTILHPETKEPLMTLQFMVDPQRSDLARLRVVPANESAEALEIEFTTGGYPTGTPWLQPRWLKAFERPDFSTYSDAAGSALNTADDAKLSRRDEAIAAYTERKERWAKDRDLSVDDHHDPYMPAVAAAAPAQSKPDKGSGKAKTLEQLNADEAARSKSKVVDSKSLAGA